MTQTNSSLTDRILLVAAGIVVVSAVVSFQVLSEEKFLIKLVSIDVTLIKIKHNLKLLLQSSFKHAIWQYLICLIFVMT